MTQNDKNASTTGTYPIIRMEQQGAKGSGMEDRLFATAIQKQPLAR